MGKVRVALPTIEGPPSGPSALRVSAMRQGTTATKSRPKATFTLVTWFKFPAVPVIVMVAIPTLTGPLAVKVRVVEDGSLVGLKPAVIPDGSPEAVKVTEP